MERWEYKMLRLIGDLDKIRQRLNEFGAEGWELVTVDEESIYYFKRRLPPLAPEERQGATGNDG